jgi:hypothetical protein
MAINFPSPTTLNQEFSAGDRTWKWNGVYWEAITTTVGYTGSGGGTSFEFDNDPPADPIPGDRWYDSTLGFEFVWVADQDSGQWVEITTSGMGYTGSKGDPGGYTGSRGDSGFAGSIGSVGFTGSAGSGGVTTAAAVGYSLVFGG